MEHNEATGMRTSDTISLDYSLSEKDKTHLTCHGLSRGPVV